MEGDEDDVALAGFTLRMVSLLTGNGALKAEGGASVVIELLSCTSAGLDEVADPDVTSGASFGDVLGTADSEAFGVTIEVVCAWGSEAKAAIWRMGGGCI